MADHSEDLRRAHDLALQLASVTSPYFEASQDNEIGARFGVTADPVEKGVSGCRAWFSDRDDAIGWSGADDTVWDLVTGKVVLGAAA